MFGRKRTIALEKRVARLEADLAAAQTRTAVANMGAALEGHTQWLTAIEQGLTDVRTAHDAELRDLGRWVAATTHQVTTMSTMPVIPSPELQAGMPPARLVDDRVVMARALQVWAVMRWLDQAPVDSDMLISVVLPTHNRSRAGFGLLRRPRRNASRLCTTASSARTTRQARMQLRRRGHSHDICVISAGAEAALLHYALIGDALDIAPSERFDPA
jgi:hypothetical protein